MLCCSSQALLGTETLALTKQPNCADSDDEDNLLHDGGKGNKQIVMVQTGMACGESEFEPLNAMEGQPNPYKNHSLPELLARRGYKAPLIGRPVMGQMHVPSDFKVTGETYAEAAQSLQLQWVQGYRGWDTRQNIYYTLGGQVSAHQTCRVLAAHWKEAQRWERQ